MHIPPPVVQSGWVSSIYHSSQLVIQDYSALQIPDLTTLKLDTLAIPALLSTSSVLLLLIHFISTRKSVKRIFRVEDEEEFEPAVEEVPRGRVAKLRHHANRYGGLIIFIFRILRLLAVLDLVGLTVATLILGSKGVVHATHHHAQLLNWGLLGTYSYASVLALVAVSTPSKIANVANTHLVWVLFGTWVVYGYRDIYPLGTFALQPLDFHEGWLMWTKLAVLTFAATIVPSFIPTQYVPFDPKNPATDVNPEQTASWFSFVFSFFLDEVIFKAARVPRLPAEDFPPLADYDWAPHLVKKSFPYLDPLSGTFKKHMFFGLMKVFRREYITMCFLLALKTASTFLSPIAINGLLTYLGEGGKGAIVRPWVWIFLLFVSPLVGSVVFQCYIFITTRLLAQTQGIITQLVFEHALRVRMQSESAESSSVSRPPTETSTPDTASVAESTTTNHSVGGVNETTTSTLTVQSSPSSSDEDSIKKSKRRKSEDKEEEKKTERGSNLIGKITNLVSTDLKNIVDGRDFPILFVSLPLQIILCIVFLYKILGWSAIAGMTTMLALYPLSGWIASKMQNVQTEKMKITDARVQVVTEVMNVIRMVKVFGWEKHIDEKIAAKREEELAYQRKRIILEIISNILNFSIAVITMIVSFACYTIVMKEEMTAAKVFSAMSVFDTLRNQMWVIFYHIPMIIQAKVSLDRVNDFLRKTELLDAFDPAQAENTIASNVPGNSSLIGIRNASFTWSSGSSGAVTSGSSRRNFDLWIKDEVVFKLGKINLIVGPTGCGKTSLLMALLGELHYIPSGPDSWFNLPRENGVAHAAQESWVQNETIRDNILFGSEFDKVRYRKVIHQCGLSKDLSLFEAGDKTEVGEKGLTLSGGQKARVTLARAIYSQAQVLILDDILAALDVHTAKWIVEMCLQGDLVRGRTVLLVTHNIALAGPVADFVVSLGQDGQILSQGTFSEALKSNKALLKEVKAEDAEVAKADETIDDVLPEIPEGKGGKLIVKEEIAEGHVSWSAIQMYIVGMGGSFPVLFWIVVLGCWCVEEFTLVIQTWFLGYWSSQYEILPPWQVDSIRYILGYAGLLVFATCVSSIATSVYVFGGLRASRTIHRRLISSVLGTTLRWLDSTPVARVIARCTQDMQSVDSTIPDYLNAVLTMGISMFAKFVAIVAFSPVFLFPGVAAFVIGALVGQIYIKAQLSVKREMSNARSPVLSHFGAAIAGIVSIRAYSAQNSFRQESLRRIDKVTRPSRTFYNLNRWISIRVDAVGTTFSSALAIYLVYGTGAIYKPGSAANIGFSLNMAVGFSTMILWWVRCLNEFEVSGNSLERIQEYGSIGQEPKPTPEGVPPAYWPASGELIVDDLSAKYSVDGPEVLHGLNFCIKSGERVGVVGRTGSGKTRSTWTL
ncbi:hypothetical protein BDM02DRAFT_3189933 [Thelephora ganbajun]|uniref:Uncharacterized protein n=1 Tax=Thelephora ganbajun TaxID=370292 RepID=A0ACB6Z688_THEGA|nr:hypothetical protein BDM02DRAFT_3189933 [Thelephora ganbajun]